ncbi:hypothetical protein [Bacillus cereus]|uniref:hypothetical protein n=1 Tax=Bacillus cereus TaxID=1396 RepID=UPI0011204F62|nr:hypothetical protein [Bacillus cereus]TNO67014.1 hypothetical protein FHR06_10635 [Bacillus cereus]
MYISDLSEDPTKFVVDNEESLKVELNNWNKKTLKLLLSNHDEPVSGKKESLVENILSAIKNHTISLATLQEWSYRYLEEGKRHLFLFDIVPQISNDMKTMSNFEQVLIKGGIERINLLYQDVQDGLVLFDYDVHNDEVSKVRLAYKEKKMLRFPNYDTDRIERTEIDYYIFCYIDFVDNTLIINVEPISGLIESGENDAYVSVKKIALRYKGEMESVFGLVLQDTHDITQRALYRIWKDATRHELPEIAEVIDNITADVESFVESIASEEKLNLNEESQTKLVHKIITNIEHTIINENYEEFKEKIEMARNTKPGFITEQNIRERSGSTLKQKSRNSSTPIEESDAFGDTIVTIDQLERVQKLTYNWNGLEDIPPGKIHTIIESFLMYDQIIFTSHTTLEEFNHVLYQLKRYKSKIRAARGSGQ